MIRVFAFIASFAFATIANAEVLKLTPNQAQTIISGLYALDGDATKTPPIKYKFDGRFLIAHNEVKLNELLKVFLDQKSKMIKEIPDIPTVKDSKGDVILDQNSPIVKKLLIEFNAMAETPVSIELDFINPVSLKIDENQIPPSIIAAINPILKETTIQVSVPKTKD